MRNPKEIKKEIRDIRADMKRQGIRVMSCFNGGLTREESMYNQNLFALKTELERAIKEESNNAC